jgi:hypothetical protein
MHSNNFLNRIKDTTIKKLDKLQTFGQYSFFSGFPYTYSTRSIGFSIIVKINREKFISLLREN